MKKKDNILEKTNVESWVQDEGHLAEVWLRSRSGSQKRGEDISDRKRPDIEKKLKKGQSEVCDKDSTALGIRIPQLYCSGTTI